jgi:hypothetical protein
MIATFKDRIIRSAKLDSTVYEEVEADKRASGQAMLVVILSSLAAGIGSVERVGISGILWIGLLDIIGWFIWAYITYFIGTKILPEPQTSSNPGELLRTIGFSRAPGLIRVFGIFPRMVGIVFLVASVWMLVTMIIAVRQALDYRSTLRAVGVCIIGWLIQAFIIFFVILFFGKVAFF